MSLDVRRVLANASWLYSAEILSNLFAVILTVVIARSLGATDLGRLVFTASLTAIAAVFSDFGLSVYSVRTLSKEPHQGVTLIPSIMTLRYGVTMTIGAVAAAYTFLFIKDRTLLAMVLISLGTLLVMVYPGMIFSLYRVRERMIYESTVRVVVALLTSLVGWFLVRKGYGVVAIVILAFFLALLICVYAWRLSKELTNFPLHLSFNWCDLKNIFIQSLPFSTVAILVTIYFRIDSLMIEHLLGTSDVGLYGSAYRVMELMLIIPGVLSGALLPTIARILDRDREKVFLIVQKAIKLLWTLAIPLSVGLSFFAKPGLVFVYGDQFAQAGPALAILGITLIPLFASAMTSMVIATANQPQVNTLIAAVMVVLNIGLNLLLIPTVGIVGAAIATLVTESFGLVAGTIYINRFYGGLDFVRFATKPLIASFVMSIAIVATGEKVLLTPLYPFAYFAALLLVKGLDAEDKALMKKVLSLRSAGSPVGEIL